MQKSGERNSKKGSCALTQQLTLNTDIFRLPQNDMYTVFDKKQLLQLGDNLSQPQSINQSIIILSEQMQKHCSHCTSIWGDITCREMTVNKR